LLSYICSTKPQIRWTQWISLSFILSSGFENTLLWFRWIKGIIQPITVVTQRKTWTVFAHLNTGKLS
jgi:hypothetical protein